MGLRGRLDELPLTDLIEMISLGGKTGRLVVAAEDESTAGELRFRAGRLVWAECGPLRAAKAFYGVLAVPAGTFDFDTSVKDGEEHCDLGIASLLMEGMRRLDEMRELRRTMPAPATVRLLSSAEAGDAAEASVLGYLGPGARTVGDIVDGMLVSGETDEYEALKALDRLRAREVVRVQVPAGEEGAGGPKAGLSQAELER